MAAILDFEIVKTTQMTLKYVTDLKYYSNKSGYAVKGVINIIFQTIFQDKLDDIFSSKNLGYPIKHGVFGYLVYLNLHQKLIFRFLRKFYIGINPPTIWRFRQK